MWIFRYFLLFTVKCERWFLCDLFFSFLFFLNITSWDLKLAQNAGRRDTLKAASLSRTYIFSHTGCELTYNSFFFFFLFITKTQQRTIPVPRENHSPEKRNAITAYSVCINAGMAKIIVPSVWQRAFYHLEKSGM